MKKLTMLIVVIIVTTCMLIGCGGDKKEDDGKLKLQFGNLLEVNENDTDVGHIVVVKAKIESALTNDQTIRQNYHNITRLITEDGFDKYDQIKYWAVADMSDGSEKKVIQFTVPKETIKGIKEEQILGTNMDEYLEDIYILPSLQE